MTDQGITIRDVCPYCQNSFKIKLFGNFKGIRSGISKKIIKPHDTCQEFMIFVDTHGKMRGYQSFDEFMAESESSETAQESLSKYDTLFEDPDNLSEFSYVVDLSLQVNNSNGIKGIITSKKIRYHAFVRSEVFKKWVYIILTSKKVFDAMLHEDLVVISAKIKDKIVLTLGIEQEKLGIDSNHTNLEKFIKKLKEMVYNVGIKLI